MWLLKASRCSHASATWWKLPKVKGPLETRARSDFVGARTSQTIGATKKTANAARIGEPQAAEQERHQSSALNSPVRVMITTLPTSPIARRSTEIAAAALKSA